MFLLGVVGNVTTNTAFASQQKALSIPSYSEQQGFVKFVRHLNDNAPTSLTLAQSFVVKTGGLPQVIRNCHTYIEVKQLLEKEELPKAIQEPKAPIEKTQVAVKPTQQQPVTEPKEMPVTEPTQEVVQPKRIALTFDDGPHKSVTDIVLQILAKHQAKATFFVLGQNVVEHPEVVQRIATQGHEIGNHSWGHRNLTKLTAEELNDEINQTNAAIFDAIQTYPKAYRPPFGATNDTVRNAIQMTSVLWNIDTLDWQHKDPVKTLANVKKQAKDNGILLMHDIHPESAQALDAVITYLEEQGYQFVTTSELLQY